MNLLYRTTAWLIIVAAFPALGCNDGPSRWPTKIKGSLYVPQQSRLIGSFHQDGIYEIHYKMEDCWPAKEYVSAAAAHMSGSGWQRMREDFLDPGRLNSWTRKAPEQWSYHFDQNGRLSYRWIDDWADNDNNIVRYFLTYTMSKVRTPGILPMDCILDADVIYIPRGVRPAPADLAAMQKRGSLAADALKQQQN
jgi:hypothetical protein